MVGVTLEYVEVMLLARGLLDTLKALHCVLDSMPGGIADVECVPEVKTQVVGRDLPKNGPAGAKPRTKCINCIVSAFEPEVK